MLSVNLFLYQPQLIFLFIYLFFLFTLSLIIYELKYQSILSPVIIKLTLCASLPPSLPSFPFSLSLSLPPSPLSSPSLPFFPSLPLSSPPPLSPFLPSVAPLSPFSSPSFSFFLPLHLPPSLSISPSYPLHPSLPPPPRREWQVGRRRKSRSHGWAMDGKRERPNDMICSRPGNVSGIENKKCVTSSSLSVVRSWSICLLESRFLNGGERLDFVFVF